MKVLTDNLRRRLMRANVAYRMLRHSGFRILVCAVDAGDALTPVRIVVSGGDDQSRVELPGCVITRRLGGAS